MRVLSAEDFLKSESAANKTELANDKANESKPDKKDQNASEAEVKAKANVNIEPREDVNKTANTNEKPKSEGEKLCKQNSHIYCVQGFN